MSRSDQKLFGAGGIRWVCWGSFVWLAAGLTLGAMSYRSPVYLYHRSPLMTNNGVRVAIVHGVGIIQSVTMSGAKPAGSPASITRLDLEIEIDGDPQHERFFACQEHPIRVIRAIRG